jgi:hypothetical protein
VVLQIGPHPDLSETQKKVVGLDSQRGKTTDQDRADADSTLIRLLLERLAEDGPEVARIRAAISQTVVRGSGFDGNSPRMGDSRI